MLGAIRAAPTVARPIDAGGAVLGGSGIDPGRRIVDSTICLCRLSWSHVDAWKAAPLQAVAPRALHRSGLGVNSGKPPMSRLGACTVSLVVLSIWISAAVARAQSGEATPS